MKCQERENLFLFFHQMLEPQEAERMRQHLAGCADCARAAEDYRKLDSALDDWSTPEPSPWFDAKVRAMVEESAGRDPGFFGFGRLRALAAGVAVVIMVFVAVVVFNHHNVVENNQSAVSRQQPLEASVTPQPPETAQVQKQPLPAEEQLKMDENLSLLEDYEVVANFDALSELPQANQN